MDPLLVLRLVLVLNNFIALSLSFAVLSITTVILGTSFIISLLFNLGVAISTMRRGYSGVRLEEPQAPSYFVMFLDIVGALAFFALYIVETIEASISYRGAVMMLAYASFGALIAWTVHSFFAILSIKQWLHYCQATKPRCPHCNKCLENGLALNNEDQINTPLAPPSEGLGSHSANEVGEAEGDRLILKD